MVKGPAFSDIAIKDEFWGRYITLTDETILPYMWQLLNDQVPGAEKSYCIRNFKVAAGKVQGDHSGAVFQDTDLYKWIEGVSYSIGRRPNEYLEQLLEEAIELIEAAQEEDGYINTYIQINKKKRWENLMEVHELYSIGHLIEAGVAHYEATGKGDLLEIVCRAADIVYKTFGLEDGKLKGYPGHPEIELALIRLYRATGNKNYLDLAEYFVLERGKEPNYLENEPGRRAGIYLISDFKGFGLDYFQAHKRVLEQDKAEGHSVRAMYLFTAMADLAMELKDGRLLKQCEILFDNIVQKRLYITGSIGSAAYGERFTSDYDLPNNSNYSETCASIGLLFFAHRMFNNTRDGKYLDVLESALYNNILAGMSLDGKHFFYVNPLEVVPEIAEHNPTLSHVKTERQGWFGVACCPPNIARTLASLGKYIYSVDEDILYVNLYINNSSSINLKDNKVELQLITEYPNRGVVKLNINPEKDNEEFTLALRIPDFAEAHSIYINGEKVSCEKNLGLVYLTRSWQKEDYIHLILDYKAEFIWANPNVRDNIGNVALKRGPIVYCLEEKDNGRLLSAIEIDTERGIEEKVQDIVLPNTMILEAQGSTIEYASCGDLLYTKKKPERKNITIKAVPYALWNNRGKGEMLVWIKAN